LLIRLFAAAAAFAAIAAPAQAALTSAGPIDPATKAPAFLADANGLQLALCHPGTPNCGPAAPGEDFYNMATSTFVMPNGGTAMLILNVTLAPNASNDPAAFNRVRVQLDGAPAGTYTITHPYGTDTVVAPGGRRGRTTIDIGCAVTAVGPCDFASALAGRYGPFLTAAPGTTPPAGFIGDAITEVPVIGSPTGNNFFRVEGPGLPAGGVQSNTFALMGKLFGGAVPALSHSGNVDFADQLVSSTSTTKTVTVTSAGIPGAGSNLAISGVTVVGANASDYAITSNTCAGANLPSGSACSVGLLFTPGAKGARSATLTFADNTAAATHVVSLAGNGTVAPAPAAPAAPSPAVVKAPAPLVVQAPSRPAVLRVSRLRVPSRLRVKAVKHSGITVRFTAPAGANVARVRLLKRGSRKPVATKTVALETSLGQLMHLRVPKAKAGRYIVDVAVGTNSASLTAPSTARLTLVR
jgi:hypothetical protein